MYILMEVYFLINQTGIVNVHIINYLNNSGSKVAVVFDGYGDIHSTQSIEHSRRSEGAVVAPDIKIENLQMKVLV